MKKKLGIAHLKKFSLLQAEPRIVQIKVALKPIQIPSKHCLLNKVN